MGQALDIGQNGGSNLGPGLFHDTPRDALWGSVLEERSQVSLRFEGAVDETAELAYKPQLLFEIQIVEVGPAVPEQGHLVREGALPCRGISLPLLPSSQPQFLPFFLLFAGRERLQFFQLLPSPLIDLGHLVAEPACRELV